jgi:voltage-gated potassium channel
MAESWRSPNRVSQWAVRQAHRFHKVVAGAVVAGAFATVPLILLLEQQHVPDWVHVIDWAIWFIFLADYTVTVLEYFSKRTPARGPWIATAVLILSFPRLPLFLSVVRFARVGSAIRFLRLSGMALEVPAALGKVLKRNGVVYIAFVTAFLVLAGGSALSVLEPEAVRGGPGEGIWWALMTATAVGSTDIAPATLWGRAIAVLLVLAGMGLISTLAASITSYFISEEAGELRDLIESNERLTARLEHLLAKMEPVAPQDHGEVPETRSEKSAAAD